MDQIIRIMWISLLLFTGQNYTDADKLVQSSLSTSYIMKNAQYSTYNHTVTQGEQITLHCIPDLNTNFIIWYFTPMIIMRDNHFKGLSISNRNDSSINETIMETIELAVCKPNVTCKEQIHLIDIQVHSNGILTIINVQSYHSGNYQCAMLAGVNTVTMNRYLIVQTPPAKPSITVNIQMTDEKLYELSKESNKEPYFIEGEYLNLLCQSEKGLPSPQIFWSFLPIQNTTITSMKLETLHDINFNIKDSLKTIENTRSSVYFPTNTPYGNTSSHFRLKVSRSHDGMQIICKAVNRIGASISEPYKISVRYAPVILQFSNEPWIVLYEEPSTIVCHAIGNPTPSIYWIDQHGQIISKTEQLNSAVFNKILIKDELGKFTKDNWTINVTCTAENIMGSIEKSLRIEFYFAPIIKTTGVVYTRHSESVRLSCDAISNPPPMNVFWYRKSNKITSNLMKSKHVNHNDLFRTMNSVTKYSSNYNRSKDRLHWLSPMLQINSVTIDDAGIYVCAAENTIKLKNNEPFVYRRESETQLLVYYSPGKPTIQKTSNPQTDENITVILQCNMNARLPGLPIPSIEWLWSSNSCKTKSSDLITPIPFKPKFSNNKDQLLINLTDTFVDGFYYCLVQNDYGNAISDPVSITVQEEPQIIEQPNIDNVLNPSFNSIPTPYLRCVAHGKPAPQVNWFHDNSIIRTTSATMNSITLRTLNDIHCSWRKILTTVKCIEYETGSYTWETTSELIWGYNESLNNIQTKCQSFHIMNEGSYTCQAINNFGYEYSNPVHIILKYPPILLHQSIIKQIIPYQQSPQQLHKHFINSTLISKKSFFQNHTQKLTCFFKANPPPNKIIWYYITFQTFDRYLNSFHKNQYMKSLCQQQQIPHDQLTLVAMQKKNQLNDNQNNKTKTVHIELYTGNKVKSILKDYYVTMNVTYMDSLYLTNLVWKEFNPVLKFGVYLSYIINDEGCQQCMVLLQNYSTPETPKNIEVKEITWDKLTLSWIPGFDGGYEQTIVIQFLKVLHKDQLTTVNNLPKSVFINHVPRLPIYQQCQISGLTPNTIYTFVIYGKNYLGHGKRSKEYTITTKELIFPKLNINYNQINFIQLNFSHRNDSQLFCIKTDYLQINHRNWSTFIDTCQSSMDHNRFIISKNKEISMDYIEIDPFIIINNNNNNGGHIDSKLQLRHPVKTNPTLIQHNLDDDVDDEDDDNSKIEYAQANSDDPNPLKVMKKSKKYNYKQSLILHNLTQNDNFSNQSIHGGHNNQSSLGVKLQKDQHIAYRIWICVRNQTDICHEEKLFSENSLFNSNLSHFKSNLGWMIIVILIVSVIICIIFMILYVKRHQSTNIPNIPLIHDKDKFSIQSNHDLFVNMNKLNGSLPQSNQTILNHTLNETKMKLSTSSLTISESTPSTIIPITCDITTHNPIPLLSMNSNLHNSIVKSSTIELTPAIIEYRPTTMNLCPNSINQFNMSSTCSLIPLTTNNLYSNDSLSSIPKCIVDSSSIIIIPAKTINLQCTNEI
ncbi:unnamed protein product [Schistosoma haematobium]|nr:unnamed protein product [Schistosoma haematobium]